MKAIFSIFLIFISALTYSQQTSDGENKRPFIVESGKIRYKVNSVRGQGTKELIFDDWGYRQRITTHISPADSNDYGRGQHQIKIITEDKNYSVNLKSNVALKLDLVKPSRSPLSDARLQVSSETILGYKCMKVKQQYTTAWLYQGIVLKLEMHDPTSGELVRREEAIAIEIPYKTSAESFSVPKGVAFY